MKTTKRKTESLGASKFHDFATDPLFEGIFTNGVRTAEEDDKKYNIKKGDVTAFEFLVDGSPVMIPAKTVIANVLNDKGNNIQEGDHLIIEYLGKKKAKSGQEYHSYDIQRVLDIEDEGSTEIEEK